MPKLWDLYNKCGEKTDISHERGKQIPQGYYHLVVSVWIVNNQGQFLISQRHPSKPYPNVWECTGGSAIAGESSLQCAVREVKEELGISLESHTAKMIYQTRREQQQEFYDVWLFRADVPLSELSLQESEVVAASWLNFEEILELQRAMKLHPLIDYLADIEFFVKNREWQKIEYL